MSQEVHTKCQRCHFQVSSVEQKAFISFIGDVFIFPTSNQCICAHCLLRDLNFYSKVQIVMVVENKLNLEVVVNNNTVWRGASYIFIFMKTNFSELELFFLLHGNQQSPTISKIRYQKFFSSNLFQQPIETRNPGVGDRRRWMVGGLSYVNSDFAVGRVHVTESCRPFVLCNFYHPLFSQL